MLQIQSLHHLHLKPAYCVHFLKEIININKYRPISGKQTGNKARGTEKENSGMHPKITPEK